ncbi:MAG: CRP/FNR family cyclic AMP-dependent transcriptional regulator [Myxococcota bacterium]
MRARSIFRPPMSGNTKQEEYAKLYKAVPLFRTLNTDELEEMIAISRLFKAPKGYTILEEGKPGHGMYVVVHGMCTCRMRLFQGDDTHLANLYKGDVFGEMSLIDDGPVSATVTTVNDCILYHIDKARFTEMRQAHRPVSYKVLRSLAPTICDRLRAINTRIGDIFGEPEKHMKLMERRYRRLARYARPVDAPNSDRG